MVKRKYEKKYDAFVGKVLKDKEEFERLKTQYFWEQKTKEITTIALWLIAWLACFILLINLFPFNPYSGIIIEYYICQGLTAILVIAVLYLVYIGIKAWINSNWEEAEDRALEEVGMLEKRETN